MRLGSRPLLDPDRNAYVDGRGDGSSILHGGEEPPALQRFEQCAIQLQVGRRLNELDGRRSIRLDAKASDGNDIESLSSKIVGNLRQQLKNRAGAYPTAAKPRAACTALRRNGRDHRAVGWRCSRR